MLRKMCKECVKQDYMVYVTWNLTGEVVKRDRKKGRTVTTLRCKKCGHEWSYTRMNHND